MTAAFIVNHLWQSSAIALFAGLLAFLLRNGPPKVRYWIWLSASLKFLLPLSLLMSLGSMIPQPARQAVAATVPAPVFSDTIIQIAEPYTRPTHQMPQPMDRTPAALGIVWALGFIAIAAARSRAWLRIRTALHTTTPIDLPIPIPAFIAPHTTEPGVVGFLKPILLLPPKLLDHLNASQLNALLAHEMSHVRRRDNLFAAIHMGIEAIFWFNPLVWWIGSRMIEERERACDEAVLQTGCESTDYVEGILKVVRLYKESELPCVAGVTGADVKKRIRAILSGNIARELSAAKKAALIAAGLGTLTLPLAMGILNAPSIHAQNENSAKPKFEVASVKRSDPGLGLGHPPTFTPGHFSEEGAGLYGLVAYAYGTKENYELEWASRWMDRYDISAKVPDGATIDQVRLMLQQLLADRFGLVIHRENRQLPGFRLVVTKEGAKLKKSDNAPAPPATGPDIIRKNGIPDYSDTAKSGTLLTVSEEIFHGRHEDIEGLVHRLVSALHEPVIDATGLEGEYDYDLKFEPHAGPPYKGDVIVGAAPPPAGPASAPPPSDYPPLFTAIKQQLGLQLDPVKSVPVEVIVMDKANREPTEN